MKYTINYIHTCNWEDTHTPMSVCIYKMKLTKCYRYKFLIIITKILALLETWNLATQNIILGRYRDFKEK